MPPHHHRHLLTTVLYCSVHRLVIARLTGKVEKIGSKILRETCYILRTCMEPRVYS